MSNRQCILVLTSTFPRWLGDSEPPFIYELCRRLTDRFDVLVIAPHAELTKQYETISKIEIIRFRYFLSPYERLAYEGGVIAKLRKNPIHYGLLPFFLLGELLCLLKVLRTRRISLIHAHWVLPQGLVAIIGRLFTQSPPPLLVTSHGGDLLGMNSFIFQKLKRFVLLRSNAISVVSKVISNKVTALGITEPQVHILPMGVDTKVLFTKTTIPNQNNSSLLFVGRLVEKKGLVHLLKALPKILAIHPDRHLDIIGDGPLRPQLEKLSEELGIYHAVHFHGALENKETVRWYRSACMLIAPSIIAEHDDQEGLGLVIIEALACGCPVIASDLPAIRDVIIDGDTGLLFKSGDSDELARKVLYLLENPVLMARLATSGASYVREHFDWQAVSEKYIDLITSTMYVR